MKQPYPTEEENNRWLARLPKKSVAVKVIIRSKDGRILMVKPIYKPTWQFPGGGVEAGEDPGEALVRELQEELGLQLQQSQFRLVGTAFRREHDNLFLIYEYQELIDEATQFTIQEAELEGYKYVIPHEVGNELSSYYDDFWQSYLAGI